MLVSEQKLLKKEIIVLVERLGLERGSLMPVLREVQQRHKSISSYAMQVIADLLKIHPVEVYGVVSFYGFLTTRPKGRFVIRLCKTISCDMQGKEAVAGQLENELGIRFGETTPDGVFSLEWTSCMGMCDQGPAMLINERVFTEVDPAKVHEILEECRWTLGSSAPQAAKESA